MVNTERRQVLKAGLGATLFLPQPFAWVWAQSEGTLRLVKAPKQALLIGNSGYKYIPGLANPGNDARSMGEVLRQSGFEVDIRVDVSLGNMASAIKGYGDALAAKKAVGIFYFAGHGVQLAWRNFLIPVDATVRRAEDIQKACIDLTALIEGMSKASNPMNILILDACRDNPFDAGIGLENRGLSQMDAPHSTLVAYATAPGNVASDGDGVNGIYTENLLREMRVTGAKIEEVFKRVRFHVRKRTNGRQVPWESTSLEDDFYFVPPTSFPSARYPEINTTPAPVRLASLGVSPFVPEPAPEIRVQDLRIVQSGKGRPSDTRRDAQPVEEEHEDEAPLDRRFKEESAMWEKIQSGTNLELLEAYLLRYPIGRYAEMAQLHYDRLLAQRGEKKVEPINDERNPYSKGSVVANTQFRLGDSYTYRQIDALSGNDEGTVTETITALTGTAVIYGSGLVTDLLGNRLRDRQGGKTMHMGIQATPLEFAVGRRWSSYYVMLRGSGRRAGQGAGFVEMDFRIVTRERITVPAGTFNAFHIRGRGWSKGEKNMLHTEVNVWHAPDRVRRPIIVEHRRSAGKRITRSDRNELVSYQES
jgi:Caspase domain